MVAPDTISVERNKTVSESLPVEPQNSDTTQRTALLIGAVSVAAGLVALGFVLAKKWRDEGPVDHSLSESVSDTLADCYEKMREIQGHLSDLSSTMVNA